jgi:penicillin amidase
MRAMSWTGLTVFSFLTLAACGGGSKSTDTAVEEATEVSDVVDDGLAEAAEDVVPEEAEAPAPCLDQVAVEKTLPIAGLSAPVEVVTDKWGVPHVYAASEADLWAAEGFVVARNRFVQMHAMRLISSGLFSAAPAAGADDLSADVYMRILNLRGVAEEMWADVQANQPEVKGLLEDFARGVNAYIAAVKAGKVSPPLEWSFLGDIGEWSPVDSLVIGRLQSWDLSFDGVGDKIENLALIAGIMKAHGGTPLAGLARDLFPLAPATDALPLPAEDLLNPRGAALATGLPVNSLARRLDAAALRRLADLLKSHRVRLFSSEARDAGSNNWVIAGEHTATGAATLANDTHLSLRNPAIFFEIHLNTLRAGGELDLAGVCFPGIPGIILGRNGHAAWGGTVYYADVTDVYLEEWNDTAPATVTFNGAAVPVTIRQEAFDYAKPEKGCADWLDDFIKSTNYAVEEVGGRCRLTVDVEEVPHHGPVIPGSKMTLADGKKSAMTWRWTGFEPSNEFKAVWGLMHMKSPADFFAALESFKVGAQNWVYADVDGHIAYATYCRIPVRQQLGVQPVENPPWLPVPGTGCCEWTGDVPLADLPHAQDPAQGFISTANGDVLGYTLDGDPFNDPTYQGYLFDLGFRAARVKDLISGNIANNVKMTVADLQAIQADHLSPLGRLLTPYIVEAVAAAEKAKAGEDGADPALAVFATDNILAARDRLAAWDFQAESGVGDGVPQAKQDSAVATSIFNAWLVFLGRGVLENKGVPNGYNDQLQAKFLLNLFQNPGGLATWSEAAQDSVAWDDPDSEQVETRSLVVLGALDAALNFLADPEKVGVANQGGFGTDDMAQWLWGKLHTVTLTSALGGEACIPPKSQLPEGFPRPGDSFVVDSSNPGVGNTGFTFSSGPAIRNVFSMASGDVQVQAVIPGGEDGTAFAPHYKDLMYLWVENQTHPLVGTVEALLPEAESCVRLTP